MRHDSNVTVTPALALLVRTPTGELRVKLSRLSAQVLSVNLREFAGQPSVGMQVNAGFFKSVAAEHMPEAAKRPAGGVVRL